MNRVQLLNLKCMLRDGEIAATDAATRVADEVFDPSTMVATAATEAWRAYDKAITGDTVALIDAMLATIPKV